MRNERLSRAAIGRMMMLCGCLAASLATPMAAADDGDEAIRATAANLTRIENKTLLLKAEERQMAVKLQLAAQRNDLAQRHAQTRMLERPARVGDPTVVAVEGIGHQRYATLMMDNGGTLEARLGDILPNGMKLLAVRAGEVIVGRGTKERIRLAQAAPPGAPDAPAAVSPVQRTPWTLPPLSPTPTVAIMAPQGGPK